MKVALSSTLARSFGQARNLRPSNPVKQISRPLADNGVGRLQQEQRKMIVGSLISEDPISSALKRRGELIAGRIERLKSNSSDK